MPRFRRDAIPCSAAPALGRARRRTALARGALAAAVLALALGALLAARGLRPTAGELVLGGRAAVVVLDVSLSITDADYARARVVLERLVRAGGRTGVVVFSDVAYELFPPRTPARELRPLLRFFTPAGGRLPPNPWTPRFQAGTRISAALELAERMLRRDRITPGAMVLVSDLETAPTDFAPLGRVLVRLERSPVALRVVPLSPTSDGLAFFGGILGPEVFVDPVQPAPAEAPPEIDLQGRFPSALLAAAGLALLALAAHEALAARLALPRGAGRRGR